MFMINRTTFEELKQISGAGFINELIDAFLEQGPEMIQNMQNALAGADVESFRRNAHSLKSNAYTFGATELGDLARELEAMAREQDINIGDRLDTLKDIFAQVVHELEGLRV